MTTLTMMDVDYMTNVASAREISRGLIEQGRPVEAVLRFARALVADERHWARGMGRRPLEDVEYAGIQLLGNYARCSTYAIDTASHALHLTSHQRYQISYDRSVKTLEMSVDEIGPIFAGIIDWNDWPQRTHAEILAAFDEAIWAAEQQQI